MKPILVNVRGCNGSGKTTVLRSFVRPDARVVPFDVPDHKPVPVTVGNVEERAFALVGDYTKGGCAGLDRVKTQAAAKYIIERATQVADVVLFEGVLVSTVFEPWLQWSRQQGGMTWAFMNTPLDECLKRIYARNGGKEIREALVKNKYYGIQRVQDRAKAAGETVITIHDGDDLRTYLKTVVQ